MREVSGSGPGGKSGDSVLEDSGSVPRDEYSLRVITFQEQIAEYMILIKHIKHI